MTKTCNLKNNNFKYIIKKFKMYVKNRYII